MTPADLKQKFREAFDLPEQERAELADLLFASLEEATADPDVEAAWAAEAHRRWQEIEAGRAETVPWEEVRSKLLHRK
jgi:putative addiction module component (TIGR02574 family)